MEQQSIENETRMEFMRKQRFESIKSKFTTISKEAQKNIDNAKPEDILALTLTFNSPVQVESAEVCDEKKFIELAF